MVDHKDIVSFVKPASLNEAVELLAKNDYFIMAGGTDAMVQYKGTPGYPVEINKSVLFIHHLDELKQVKRQGGDIVIGACATFSELLSNDYVPTVLKGAIKQIASPAIRNRGTIGGNICNASPAGDTLPLLYIYDAHIVLQSKCGRRLISIKNFIKGPRKIDLAKGELIVEIILPEVNEKTTLYRFEKVGSRKADAISKLSMAGARRVENNVIKEMKIVFGAVGATMVYDKAVEEELVGERFPLQEEILNKTLKRYSDIINPIDDQRSTADYRKKVALNLLRDFCSL